MSTAEPNVTRARLETGDTYKPKSGRVYELTSDGKLLATLLPPTDRLVRALDRERKVYASVARKIARLTPRLIAAEKEVERKAMAMEEAANSEEAAAALTEFEAAEVASDKLYDDLAKLDGQNPDGEVYGLDVAMRRLAIVASLTYDGKPVESAPDGVDVFTIVGDAVVKDFERLAFMPTPKAKK